MKRKKKRSYSGLRGLNVRGIPPNVLDEFARIAAANDTTVPNLIRSLVANYVSAHEKWNGKGRGRDASRRAGNRDRAVGHGPTAGPPGNQTQVGM